MRAVLTRAALVVGAVAVVGGLALSAAGDRTAANPACITWQTEVRYRPYGYDHVVVIHNECDRNATCGITTNVNPNEIRVVVEAGRDAEVVTFAGSPSRDFTAAVHCELAAQGT